MPAYSSDTRSPRSSTDLKEIHVQISRKVRGALSSYGPKSNLHGLYHCYQTENLCRRIFWLIILILALGATAFHTTMTAMRYARSDVFVYISDESKAAIFPEITICNLKPFTESGLVLNKKAMDMELSSKWDYFDKWFLEARERRPNETDLVFKTRLKTLFSKFMELDWVSSGKSRDIGTLGRMFILMCSYEGIPCDHRNFTLVRDPEGWNCFNFASDGSSAVGSHGLTLVLFTDSAFFHPIYFGAEIDEIHPPTTVEAAISEEDKRALLSLKSLKSLLQSKKLSLNQVAARGSYQSNGVRLTIHEPNSHPMTSLNRLEFQTGITGLVIINQMMMHRMRQPGMNTCRSRPYEKIQFVTDFIAGNYTEYRNYNKLLDEYVVEEKQGLVHKACGCYSHSYPFWVPADRLCYYTPESQMRVPSKELLDRISCHDAAVLEADSKTDEVVEKHNHNKACESTMLSFTTDAFRWPSNEDIINITNNFIMRALYKPKGDGPTLGVPDPIMEAGTIRREEAALKLLFGCSQDPKPSQWCTDSHDRLRQNILKLQVKHLRSKSRLATEKDDDQWPEMVSELGGTVGVWLGISVISAFELVELVYSIIIAPSSKPMLQPVVEGDAILQMSTLPSGEEIVCESSVSESP